MKTKKADVNDRRSFLKVAGAGLAAASLPTAAAGALTGAQKGDDGPSPDRSRPIYLHGCGWNRALPGVFGEVCLAFDIRAELGAPASALCVTTFTQRSTPRSRSTPRRKMVTNTPSKERSSRLVILPTSGGR